MERKLDDIRSSLIFDYGFYFKLLKEDGSSSDFGKVIVLARYLATYFGFDYGLLLKCATNC